MSMNRVIGVAAAAGCAALVITGCGTTQAPSPGAGVSPSAAASAVPRQRASTDAASILASFVPPPGAVRLTAAPGGAGAALRTAPGVGVLGNQPDRVQDTSWWRIPGSPQSVLSWEKAHLPARFSMFGQGTSGSPPAMWQEQFALPAVAGVLSARYLMINAVDAGGGQAALRVDSQVSWLPAKPAAERVPAAAKVVTISATPGPMVGAKVPAPVTITNAGTVERIAALADGLPVYPPGAVSCPMELGKAVQLTFRPTPGGPPLAVVSAGLTGCQGVRFTVGGEQQPALAGGAELARQVLLMTGLRWTGYGGGQYTPGGAMTPGGVNPGGVMQHG
jgi:hypothetical protein